MKKPSLFASAILALLLAACGANTLQPTPTETVIFVPTQTDVPSPTNPPPTATQLPSATPSPFPTLPILATLTPATPGKNAEAYHLANQTADQANETIARIEQAILGLENAPVPENAPGYRPNYEPYYKAAWYAAWDALAHFPNDPRAELWRWKMPYYMTLAGDSEDAAKIYANKITAALNSGETTPVSLEEWFHSGELENTLYTQTYKLKAQLINVPGDTQSYLVELGRLEGVNIPGELCFLVVKNSQIYASYLIYNGFQGAYDSMIQNPVTCSLKDVTNDGINEVIVNQYTGGHYGTNSFQVIDVSSLPPQILPFTKSNEQKLEIWNGGVQGYPIKDGETQIQASVPIGDLNCDNYYDNYYRWNGTWFELYNQKLHFGVPSNTDDAAFCVDTTIGGLYDMNNKEAADFLEQAIQAYRPHANNVGDILNELILRQAVYYALQGETEKARSKVDEVIQNPIVKDSVWVIPAKKFLAVYKEPADLYRAASELISCTSYRNLESAPNKCLQIPLFDVTAIFNYILTDVYPSIPLDKVVMSLKESGVKISAEGWFDFDQDQKKELWFTFYDPQNKNFDLWIAAETPKGNAFFNPGFYEPNVARPTFRIIQTSRHPYVINLGDDQNFEFIHNPENGDLTMGWLSVNDLSEQPGMSEKDLLAELEQFTHLRQQLLTNGNPVSIHEQLAALYQKYTSCPFEIAKPDGAGIYYYYYDCAGFYYAIALSAELAEKPETAVALYHKIWSEYPDSPFASLARLKLER